VENAGHRHGLEEEDRPGENEETEHQGGTAEGDELGDIQGREPPGRIKTVAHRAAGNGAQAHVDAEGEADEGGHGDLAVGEALADIAEGEKVIAGHHEVVEAGEGEAQEDLPGRDLPQGAQDVVDAMGSELPLKNPEGHPEEEKAEEGAQDSEEPSFHGLSRFRIGRRDPRLSIASVPRDAQPEGRGKAVLSLASKNMDGPGQQADNGYRGQGLPFIASHITQEELQGTADEIPPGTHCRRPEEGAGGII